MLIFRFEDTVISLPFSYLKFGQLREAQSMLNILENPIFEMLKYSCMLTNST
jgi:hypothetical protein